jgi:hypothetical protein
MTGQVAALKLFDEVLDALHETPSLRLWIDFVQLDDQTVRDEVPADARRHAAAIPDAQLVAVFESPVRASLAIGLGSWLTLRLRSLRHVSSMRRQSHRCNLQGNCTAEALALIVCTRRRPALCMSPTGSSSSATKLIEIYFTCLKGSNATLLQTKKAASGCAPILNGQPPADLLPS